MRLAWQTPKTDWKVTYDESGNYQGDYFEAADYQRIKGNLEYLAGLAAPLFGAVTLPAIPDVTEQSYGYASYINALEQSIETLKDATADPGLPATKTWQGNAEAPLWSDLNRIESAILTLYLVYTAAENALPKLSFEMGGSDF